MRGLLLVLLLPLAFQDPPEPAVSLAWKLARTDFARYRSSTISFDSGGDERAAANPLRTCGLFGYEISEGIRYRPSGFETAELPILLGFSLPPKPLKIGQAHDWSVDWEEGWDYAPITARCSATRRAAVDVEGVSCVAIDLKARITALLRADPPPKSQRVVEKGMFEGTLLFDAAKGVARRLDFIFSLTLLPTDPKGNRETTDFRERLELEAVLPNRYRGFEGDVITAIDKGLAWVWRQYQEREGHWGFHYEHKPGPTALSLLTILKGSSDRKDPRLGTALNWMLDQTFEHTYDTAVSLMALEAYYSPKDETVKQGQAPAADKEVSARIDPVHARWVGSAARWLEMKLAKDMWSYPSTDAEARDFSNTQYGVLGLYSAARCGATPDLAILRRVAESYLRVQQKKGPRVELALVEADSEGKTGAKQMAEARGWPYYDHPLDPIYGSMTAGGLSSLVILDALRRRLNDSKYDARERARVKTALRDGWAWLQLHWTVKGNPTHGRDWLYYFLYGLERCGMLDGVARLGEHDWYAEGATLLISNQTSGGYWHTGKYVNLYDNCFAILFLKRATMRVATGK